MHLCIGVLTIDGWRGGGMEWWVVKLFCCVRVLGQHCDCELMGVLLMDVGFEMCNGL